MKFSRSSTELVGTDGRILQQFFDSIALRYDFLNHLLSFRLDESWRRRSRDLVLEGSEERLLDLGTGTGKFLELFLEAKSWKRLAGLDFSSRMLQGAREILPDEVALVSGDFEALPFQPQTFDLVISSFTLRSIREMEVFLKGVFDLLADGGKAAFLCLTRPENPFWRGLCYPYLKFYLPFVGGLLTGHRKAYQFLADSILTFQEPIETAEMMKASGFSSVSIHRFTLGLATLIVGKKETK